MGIFPPLAGSRPIRDGLRIAWECASAYFVPLADPSLRAGEESMKNIGILGFAHGHVGMYISRWRDQPEMGIKVVAGWDHDAARAEGNCANFGLQKAESVEALLKSDIEAVVIAAETSKIGRAHV